MCDAQSVFERINTGAVKGITTNLASDMSAELPCVRAPSTVETVTGAVWPRDSAAEDAWEAPVRESGLVDPFALVRSGGVGALKGGNDGGSAAEATTLVL